MTPGEAATRRILAATKAAQAERAERDMINGRPVDDIFTEMTKGF